MSLNRIIVILLALAFLSVMLVKATRTRQEQRARQTEAASSDRIRQFWDVYRQASQRRAAGELEAAIALYQNALKLKPDHEDSLYYAGNCYFELGRYQEAIAANERLIAANPLGSSRGYMQLGLIYSCLEPGAPFDLEKAGHFFDQSLKVDPDSGALLGIGEVALLAGQWQKAWDSFKSDNADNAMSMASPYLLGYLCWRKGEREEAWRWFRLSVSRGELKKPAIKWTEEGNVKADPELRWQALARQSALGKYWLRLRRYLKKADLSPAEMESEYQLLRKAIAAHRSAAHR
jgi:tetratricopeptide (TPR) repeat protein